MRRNFPWRSTIQHLQVAICKAGRHHTNWINLISTSHKIQVGLQGSAHYWSMDCHTINMIWIYNNIYEIRRNDVHRNYEQEQSLGIQTRKRNRRNVKLENGYHPAVYRHKYHRWNEQIWDIRLYELSCNVAWRRSEESTILRLIAPDRKSVV